MNHKSVQDFVSHLFQSAGISVSGSKPWDVQIHNKDFYTRVLKDGSLGLGEAYMDGWWDSPSLDQFIEHVVKARLASKVKSDIKLLFKFIALQFFNMQTKKRAFQVGIQHYDLGNDLFESMLDSRLNYTCGYWKNAQTLEEAQLHKMDLVCQKLMLKPGMRVLDIGCGFGSLAKYAAENFGASVVGVTISKEQCHFAKQNCAGLPVEIRLQDYRDVDEKFDRIVSLGMFEHVGHLNHKTYMQMAHKCLRDDGLFLLHTIGSNTTDLISDPWIEKYIFPNGILPSIQQIAKASEDLFVMEDWHNFGSDYSKTLLAWHENFNKNWSQLKKNYDERFFRMWNYYLLSCAGSFRARYIQLWQIVFSKSGVPGGYVCPR